MRAEEGAEGAGLALKYRLTSCTVHKHVRVFLSIYTATTVAAFLGLFPDSSSGFPSH